LVGDAILSHYKARLKEIEGIIRDRELVSLPARDARIRIATEAESAAVPAPNMHPPDRPLSPEGTGVRALCGPDECKMKIEKCKVQNGRWLAG
jgi:hypothetical protein